MAIIGCGRISYKHIEAIVNNHNELSLLSVCDLDQDKAVHKAEEYITKLHENYQKPLIYDDYAKMLREIDLDLVAIATESGYHAEIAIGCLKLGKHVIVEKPMALSTDEADRMIEAAKANHVKIAVCHQNRFNKPVQSLHDAIAKGRFGRIINGTARILWNRDMKYYQQAPWRGTWKLDGGTLMNQCIHNIDLLQWMMGGDIETVYAQTGNFLRDIEAEDFGSIIIRFKNKSIGIVEGSACVFPKNLEETLSIFGEKGTACLGGLAVSRIETWRFADEMDSETDILKQQEADPDSVYGFGHTPLYKDVILAIKENREPLINGQAGKIAMKIVLAAYKSQKTGLPVIFDNLEFSTTQMDAGDVK
jgi:predicted dehydrogenase